MSSRVCRKNTYAHIRSTLLLLNRVTLTNTRLPVFFLTLRFFPVFYTMKKKELDPFFSNERHTTKNVTLKIAHGAKEMASNWNQKFV